MSQKCPVCAAEMPDGRLSGLCPACTWNGLFGSDETIVDVKEGDSPAPLMRVAGYQLLDVIARGGFGIVYRARQMEPRRTVALKMLLPNQMGSAETAERFRLEVRALSELEHPSILPVHQMGEHEGLPYFTMKLATGGTLAQRKETYAGNWRAIAELLIQLSEAVQFAHERGVLHRDLKPGNILFDDQKHPYVSDFGLAKLANNDADLTRSLDFLGTPNYVAPEIATRSARQATIASDVYSLGAILYELLTGRQPFEAESVPALLKKIVEDEPIKPSSIGPGSRDHSSFGVMPRDLEVICLKCLAKEPEKRYASAQELAEDLRRWLQGKPILARAVTATERLSKWIKRNPVMSALAAALIISLAGGSFALWRSDREVRKALSITKKAENQSQQNLRDALLAQAKALGAAHATGQRWAALEALARAAQVRPSLELRNEATAALARSDVREIRRFPANIGGAGSTVVFTSDLEQYVSPEPAGGFTLRRAKDREIVASFRDSQNRPARWFVLSPDDREIAAVMNDYGIEFWPVGAEKPRLRWEGTRQQPAVAEFHPNGSTLAGYTTKDGLFLQTGQERQPFSSTNGRTIYIRFDPGGTRMAVVRDGPGGVEMWRCSGQPTLLWWQPMKLAVPWLSWSPDGSRLAAAANDGHGLRIFSASDGRTELVYSQHLLYPRQFEFDPTGRIIASMGEDWALRLWDTRTGQDLVTSVGRHRVMRFSRDGRWLSTAPSDWELAILERAPEQVFREFRGSPAEPVVPSRLVRSRDGRLIAAVQPQLRIYDTERAEEIGVLNMPGVLKQLYFDTNDSALLYSLMGNGIYRRAYAWTSNSLEAPAFQWGKEELLARHPDGIIWNAVDLGDTWVCHANERVEIWPKRDPKQARRLPIRVPLERLVASQSGYWLAAPDYANDGITVWDSHTGATVTNLPARLADQVWFSPNSKWIVVSTDAGYCTWETGTWKPGPAWEARLNSGDPGEIAFSDDGKLIAARQERESFRLLRFPECQELVTLKPPLVLPIRSACFAPDGGRLWLMSSGYRVFEWNLSQLHTELAKVGLAW
jgi:serine/threonine protein kinase/WD40 repeat protein